MTDDRVRLGGMALANGVLVHSPRFWSCAVRTDDGSASHDVASVQQELANVRRELDEALASADSGPTGDTESETATTPG